jgi:hypothetical protein
VSGSDFRDEEKDIVFMPRYERKNRQEKLKNRHLVSDSEIYEKSYSASGFDFATFQSVWHRIASALHVDAGTLRPEDQLAELSGNPQWLAGSEDLSDLEHDLNVLETNQKANKYVESIAITTIDGLVRRLAKVIINPC